VSDPIRPDRQTVHCGAYARRRDGRSQWKVDGRIYETRTNLISAINHEDITPSRTSVAMSVLSATIPRMLGDPRRRPFILAVDDDPTMHDAFELIFSDEEYEFLGVCDGREALEILEARPADVVLLDLLMPGMGGLEVLRRIKASRPTTNVIVVSVVDQVRPGLESLRLGAADYLTKPFEEEQLQLLVRQAIAQTSATNGRSSRVPIPTSFLIISEHLGVRATLAAALGRCGTVSGVRTAADAAPVFGKMQFDIVVADVAAGESTSEETFVRIQADYASLPLIWIASPSQCVPFNQGRCTILRTPLDYAQALAEAARLIGQERESSFRKIGRISGRLMTYVSEHFAEASVEDVAQAIGLSPGHLCRVFRDEIGLAPKDFLTRVRLEAAKCLLRETREKVGAIATTVGFYDAPHLARLFKSYLDRTPREYRQSYWNWVLLAGDFSTLLADSSICFAQT
jgi:two-component system response regulator YesN